MEAVNNRWKSLGFAVCYFFYDLTRFAGGKPMVGQTQREPNLREHSELADLCFETVKCGPCQACGRPERAELSLLRDVN